MKYTTRAIYYNSRMELATQIAKTAPIGYTGFKIHPDISKGFCNVTYARGIDTEYISVQKLRDELNMGDVKPTPVEKPSLRDKVAWELHSCHKAIHGKHGTVLVLDTNKPFIRLKSYDERWEEKLKDLRKEV